MTTVLPPAVFGVSGNVSRQMLDRVGSLALDDIVGTAAVPDVALVYGFPNDPALDGQAVDGSTWTYSQAVSQNWIQGLLLSLKHAAYGDAAVGGGAFAATPAALPARGNEGQRIVVLSDTSTTGGAAALAGTGQAATITGTVAGSGPSVWEFRRRQRGTGDYSWGWGRIAVSSTPPTSCKRIVMIGTNYKNFATDGTDVTAAGSAGKRDTLATPEPWYAQIRAATKAAVTAESSTVGGLPTVVYGDLYTYQKTMITGGTFPSSGTPALADTYAAGFVPDFSGGATYDANRDWHYANSNQHHGDVGHEIVARVALLSIVNAGWIPALSQLSLVNMKALGDSQSNLDAGYAEAFRTWGPTLGRRLQDYLDSL